MTPLPSSPLFSTSFFYNSPLESFWNKFSLFIKHLDFSDIYLNDLKLTLLYLEKELNLVGVNYRINHPIPDLILDLPALKEHQPRFLNALIFHNCHRLANLFLSDERIDPNIKIDEKFNPFTLACARGNFQIAESLLQNPRVDSQIQGNYTPLQMACANNRPEILNLLLADGRFDINQVDEFGATILTTACFYGYHKLALSLLLTPGIDVNIHTLTGIGTPVYLANQYGWKEMTQILADCFNISLKTASLRGKMTAVRPVLSYIQNDPVLWKKLEPHLEPTIKIVSSLLAAEILSTTLFLCRGYLSFISCPTKLQLESKKKAIRYFSIAQKLPLEIQMILSNRLHCLMKTSISSTSLKRALQKEAKIYWLPNPSNQLFVHSDYLSLFPLLRKLFTTSWLFFSELFLSPEKPTAKTYPIVEKLD